MKHKCIVCNRICNSESCNNNIRNNYWKWLFILIIFGIVLLLIGILGYYLFNHHNWIDAIYDASMVMSGVGATDIPSSDTSRIFGAIYSLVTQLFYVIILTAFIAISLAEIKFFENE